MVRFFGCVAFRGVAPRWWSECNAAWQILAFLGDVSKDAQTKADQLQKRRKTSIVASKLSANSVKVVDDKAWQASRIYEVGRKITWEISHSFEPLSLNKWIKANSGNDSKMASLFTFSAWYLTPALGGLTFVVHHDGVAGLGCTVVSGRRV